MSDPAQSESSAAPEHRRMQIFLGIVLLVLVLHLIFGDHPWKDGIVKREARGDPIRPVDLWVSYGYWVAAVNTLLVGGALFTLRRWFDRRPAPVSEELAAPARPSRLALALAGLAVVAGVLIAIPRLDQSLWDDEVYSVRRAIWGGYFLNDDEELVVRRLRLRDNFWYYRKPNNHVPHTLMARGVLEVWAFLTDPPLHFVSERVLRIPALLAGGGSIAAVAWLAWRMGFMGAGILAAWMLALHPWHSRYLSEARGYSLVMCLVSVTVVLLISALHRGTWRRWIAYGAAQFLLAWAYPAIVYHLVLLNLIGPLYLWKRHSGEALRSQVTRWFFANATGAMLWVQLMTPNMVQFLDYAKTIHKIGGVSRRWLEEFASHLAAGTQYHTPKNDPGLFFYPVLEQASPIAVEAFALLALVGLVLGAARLVRTGGLYAWLLAVFLLPGPLVILQSYLHDDHIYFWYVIFVLPTLALLLGIGLTTASRDSRLRDLYGFAIAGFFGLLLILGEPTHRIQWERPFFPLRESVEATRPVKDPMAEANRRTVTAGWTSGPFYYDPAVRMVKTKKAFNRLVRRARKGEVDLYVNLGRIRMARARFPELTKRVERGGEFEAVAVIPGFTEDRTRYVWRYVRAE